MAAVAGVLFFYAGYEFLIAMADRHWSAAVIAVTVSLTAAPFCLYDQPLRTCSESAACIVAGVFGAVACHLAYFAMMHIGWLERIFNDKGAGPLGLIMAVTIGFCGAATSAWFALRRAQAFISRRSSLPCDG